MTERLNSFASAIREHEGAFGITLGDETIAKLTAFYEIVEANNPLLHLVAPMPPEEFAVRHVLESLTLLRHLRGDRRFADVGPGAGLPSIPCLIADPATSAVLIESKEKKAAYLREAFERLELADRVTVVNKQFAEVDEKPFTTVVCRALDRFSEHLPRLVKWSAGRDMLLFGGRNLETALTAARVSFTPEKMPTSDQRYLYICKRTPGADLLRR